MATTWITPTSPILSELYNCIQELPASKGGKLFLCFIADIHAQKVAIHAKSAGK